MNTGDHIHSPERVPRTERPFRPAAVSILTGLLLAMALIAPGCTGSDGAAEGELQARAARIHAASWIADTHIDAPSAHAGTEWDARERHTYEPGAEDRPGQWDLPRMTEGGLDAAFMVVFVGQGPLTPEGYEGAWERAMQLFDWAHAVAASDPNTEIAYTVADAQRLHAEGKRALFIGVENGYPMGRDLKNVELFYQKGMRYVTLAHSGDNEIAASSGVSDEVREDYGLTDYGRRVVRELNRLGVMVDVSHVSDQSFYDVLEMTDVPVVLSHSGCRALASNSRNITDDMLRKLAENGGVIQLVALGSFIRDPAPNPQRDQEMEALRKEFSDLDTATNERRSEYRRRRREIFRKYPSPPATLEDFMKQIDHAVAVAGIDHIGFGSDFDGGGGLEGLEDVTDLPEVTIAMLRRGYTDQEIEKFWGGNLLRVMAAVEAAAERAGNQ